jgi:hypothetical protein
MPLRIKKGKQMKKALLFLAILSMQLLLTSNTYSKEEKTIKENNEYGGKTEEETYAQSDDKYKEGINKIIEHYDSGNKIREIESYYTDDQSKIDGIYRREQYYEHSKIHGSVLKKSEFFYTDTHSNIHGLLRSEIQYDDKGVKKKEEFFYTDAFAKKKVYSKVEVFYEEGKPEKRIYYDKNGKVISTEEKKKLWKSQ